MPGHQPLIGVSASITVDKHPERAYVNSTYLRAVQQAGGVPVLCPPSSAPPRSTASPAGSTACC